MAEARKIKWRDKDRKKLARKVAAFNAKRTRMIKKVPELASLLPEKINIREWEKAIATRRDFNYAISRIDNFFKKDATKIVTVKNGDEKGTTRQVTKWERDDVYRAARRFNRRRAKMVKAAGFNSENDEGAQDLRGLKFPGAKNVVTSWKGFSRVARELVWESTDMNRAERYHRNYIQALHTVYGDSMPEEMELIADIIKNLTPEEMNKALWRDHVLDIDFIYLEGDDDDVFTLIPLITHWLDFMDKEGIKYDLQGRVKKYI